VEVFIKGSDIETPRRTATRDLRDTLETAIASQQGLRLVRTGEGDLVVLIPEFVNIERSQSAERIVFGAQLTRKSNGEMRTVTGSCERQALGDCARIIVEGLEAMRRAPGS
jgi:hypothetical protein